MDEIKAIIVGVSEYWEEYNALTQLQEETQSKLDSLSEERSNVVKGLLAANGGEKVIQHNGQTYTIIQRGELFYIRSGKAGRPAKKTLP